MLQARERQQIVFGIHFLPGSLGLESVDQFRFKAFEGSQFITAVGIHSERTVDLGRGVLACLRVMTPPENLENFHAAVGTSRGGIVFKKLWKNRLDCLGVCLRVMTPPENIENFHAAVGTSRRG